jgi:hypothetical protein
MDNRTYRQALRDQIDRSGLSGVSSPSTPRFIELTTDGFKNGAKYAASYTQALGEILQNYADQLSPGDLMKCRLIFEKNKEIINEQ